MAFNLASEFQPAFSRRIAQKLVAAALVALAAVIVSFGFCGKAQAQSASCQTQSTTGECDTQQEAAAVVTGLVVAYGDSGAAGDPVSFKQYNKTCYVTQTSVYMGGWIDKSYSCSVSTLAGNGYGVHQRSFTRACPVGREWNGSVCACPSGQIEGIDGSCKSCLELNTESGSPATRGEIVRPFSSKCVGGCTLAIQAGSGFCVTIGTSGGGATCSGHFEYTGASCSVNPVDPPYTPPPATEEPKDVCNPAGSGQTMCLKRNGDHCYTSSTGKQTCWTPGETGQKGQDDNLQVRGPGATTPTPKSTGTQKGDNYSPVNSPTTTVTTSPSTTVTTTTQNYKTDNGTSADDQAPQTDDGSDKPIDDGKSASGGGDCKSPPIVSGDVILGMVATQAWSTRCAVEAGNSVSVTGDVADCASGFAVEGTSANAVKLRAMRASICGDNQPNWTKGDKPSNPGEGDGEDGTGHTRFGLGIGPGMLDTSDMIGGGSCQQFSITIYGKTISTADMPYWCTALGILRALILIFAAYTAVRLLTGSKE